MPEMKDLYSRLRQLGFDSGFVRERMLPDWWDDSLAEIPANRALAEASISKMLGIPMQDLASSTTNLKLPEHGDVKLKRRANTEKAKLMPALVLAERMAASIVRVLRDVPKYDEIADAASVRKEIMKRDRAVGLESLLDFAWKSGIVVIHLSHFPRGTCKFHGLAMYTGERPVIVLGFGSDSPPWLAFHLAHELAHIALGHVRPGEPHVADATIDSRTTDDEEKAADAYASELLTGYSTLKQNPIRGLTAPKLMLLARVRSEELSVDPGAIVLAYGRTAERMGVAQNAIKLLGMDRGGQRMIANMLRKHLDDDLPDHTSRFVALTAAA